MRYRNRYAKVNVKLLIILILVTVALGVSLVAARQIRRSILSKMSLTAGEMAFEKGDWPAAYRDFQEYLGQNPDDVEILKKYAKARLSIRPLVPANIAGAISAYRRVLQLAPLDDVAYDQLAKLYAGIGNYEDLAYIARMRLEHTPNDPNDRKAANDWKAPLWLAEALMGLNKAQEARQTLEKLVGELKPLPDRHIEYVKACVLMCQLAATNDSAEAKAKALEWLNKAAAYDPNSIEALACRARFYRQTSNLPGIKESDRTTLARKDLEAADGLRTESPQIRYFLGGEWLEHNELDRAARELQAVDQLPQEKLEEHFFDLDTWKVRRFLFASQLALRRGAAAEGAAVADETLTALKETRHRIQVLPIAIPLYVAAGKVSDARRCLKEYVDARHVQEGAKESRERLAYLQALVARAEGNSYAVIDALQPAVVGDTSRPELFELWRLLAEAFTRTDQSRRAISALTNCLRYRSGDPQTILLLAREYLRLRDWNKALETASLAQSPDPTDYLVRLLRIEAGINVAAEQQQKPTAATFHTLSQELAQLRADHPDDVDIRILQAIIADLLEQSDQAEAELKLAVEQCKEPLRAAMQLVKHYYRVNRMDEAIRVCQDACERHAEVAEPWLSLSSLHMAKGQHDAARDCLRKGLNATADKWEKRSLSIQLALLEITRGDRAAGIARLSDLAAQDANEIRVRSLLLDIQDVQKDQARAQRLINELHQAEGQNGTLWRVRQAALWLSSKDWRSKQRDITELLQTCMNLDPGWSAPPLLLAEMYERLNDLQHVEDTCKQALIRNPSATEIADRLVTLFEKQKRFSDAEQVLRQIEANPSWRSGRQVLSALRSGDFNRAVQELEFRVAGNERDVDSRILLARLIYWQKHDAAEALKHLREAEAIAPDSLALIGTKAAILRAEKQTAEAKKILDDYMESHKNFAAYSMRASYLASEGQLEQAEEDYKKLITFPENALTGYQLLSSFYLNTKRLDQAVATMEEGLNSYPADLSLERGLMRLLFVRAQGRDRERAVGILESLEKQLPDDPELMKFRATLMLERPTVESVGKARAILENVVKREPTAVDAHLTLVNLATQASEYRAARDYAIRALGSNSNNRALLLARARAELALQNYPMAGELTHLVLQEDPNSAEALDVLVETGQRSKNRTLLDEARTRVDAAVRRAPANERLLLTRARILATLQQPKAALPELETYCQTTPGSSSIAALVTLADLYRLAGDADRSKQRIEQARQLDSTNQTVVHARLLWLVSQNRLDDLKGISSAYLSGKGQDLTMLVGAASILTALNPMELKKEGLKLFEYAVTLSPTSVGARLGLASALYQTGDAERAEKTYREVLGQYPDNVRALNDLAWILQERYKRYDTAVELANKGLKIASEDLNLLDTRGTILMNLPNRLADARSDFQKLVNLSPGDTRERAKALLQLSRVCVKLKDPPKAEEYLEEALKIEEKLHVFTPAERAEITEIMPKSEN